MNRLEELSEADPHCAQCGIFLTVCQPSRQFKTLCYYCGNGRTTNAAFAKALETPDMVNAPPHYRAHPSGVECITVVEHLSFNVGNAVKYLWRAGEKGAELEDLKKAAWYVAREIAKKEKEKK